MSGPRSLRLLNLVDTSATPQGVAALKKRIPGITIGY